MTSREDYIRVLSQVIALTPSREQSHINCMQALLLMAATVANAKSEYSVGYSAPKIEEAAEEMGEVLARDFGIEIWP